MDAAPNHPVKAACTTDIMIANNAVGRTHTLRW